eukprot:s1722_g2.t1
MNDILQLLKIWRLHFLQLQSFGSGIRIEDVAAVLQVASLQLKLHALRFSFFEVSHGVGCSEATHLHSRGTRNCSEVFGLVFTTNGRGILEKNDMKVR